MEQISCIIIAREGKKAGKNCRKGLLDCSTGCLFVDWLFVELWLQA